MKEDKTLTCCECGQEFVFTASEQEFYAEKGFTNEPRRCPTCRQARKQRMAFKPSVRNAKCSPQPALNVARKPWFPSSPPTIVRYTAAIASTLVKLTNF